MIARLAARTGLPLTEAKDHFAAQGARDALVETSGQLRVLAVSLVKIANDLRWMGSGPRTGLGEIRLPDLQPGSSIMPGKVNPVIPEVVTQVGAQVIGNDAAVAFGGSQGNFELNVFVPVIARNLLESIDLLANVCAVFADKCIRGIEANTATLERYAEASPAVATALNPYLGYETTAEIIKESKRDREVGARDRARPQADDRRGARPRARRRGDDPGRDHRVMASEEQHDSKRAIVAAFLANLGIALMKFVAFVVTHSSSMLSESIHSLADTGNQGLLLLGRARARRPADEQHPFGYGSVRYFYAFIVAFVLFSLGGVFSVFEGVDKLRHPHARRQRGVGDRRAARVDGDGGRSRSAPASARRTRSGRPGESWWGFIRHTKSPDLPVVLLEDAAALVGLVFALVGVVLADVTGNGRWDGVGSLGDRARADRWSRSCS